MSPNPPVLALQVGPEDANRLPPSASGEASPPRDAVAPPTRVATVVKHLVQTSRAKTRVLLEHATDEGQVQIQSAHARTTATHLKTLRLDRIQHRVSVHTKRRSDRARRPVLRVVQA